MDRMAMIKAAAEKAAMRKTITKLDGRKKEIKEEMKLHKKLTKSVKMAGKQSPSSLDAFSESSMYYSEKEVKDYLAGSQIMESYEAMRIQDEY